LKIRLLIMLMGFIAAFQHETENVKGSVKVISMKPIMNRDIEMVEGYHPKMRENSFPTIFAQHKINGNNVFVECIVTGITFRQSEDRHQKVGKIVVWIDGKRHSEVDSPIFIIRGLKQGSHRVILGVVNLNNISYGLEKEFVVTIR
jgi:hypothetical protein